MMGLPDLPKRLPSRNWTIFFTITGSLTAAIIYDKRETKRAQRKWCKLVEHLALEPLDPRAMPRRLTVFLEAPPADGLRLAQDHFKEYVKPVLVASGLDWDFIQGRKEGDVRAELADKIRKLRLPLGEEPEDEEPALRVRRQNGTKDFDGPQGDIILGRNTWKEYVRGLHEGWLGPLSEPKPEISQEDAPPKAEWQPITEGGITILTEPREADSVPDTPAEGEADKPKTASKTQPFISTAEYAQAGLPPNLPTIFDLSVPIEFPHILGFFNTFVRLQRFLNRRQLADSIGRDVAAIILSTSRPYEEISGAPATSFEVESLTADSPAANISEQALALVHEEKDWHKSIKKHTDDEPERIWLNDIVLDPRIASRMQRAQITPEDEARAAKIVVPEEEIEGWIKGTLRGAFRMGKEYFVAEKSKGPNVGNIDDESL
jgi:import inner membrane translocase subunit TIM54